MQGMYSTRSPAVKRLMKEAQELREPTEQYHAQPLEDNLFEWHFTIRGPGESEFEEGIYHGRIILPPEYPMKPPSIILLTPNGRFEIFKKICLSISGHHPESWQPSWSIRTALLAIIGFMPTHGGGAIGSLDYPSDERKRLAKRSLEWKCPTCGNVHNILKPVTAASKETAKEAKELASQINFQAEKQPGGNKDTAANASSADTPTSSTTSAVSGAEAAAAAASSQFQIPAGQNPFLSGQPNFCFPPPFMAMPNMYQQQSSNLPPRFPPPPPFIPSMFPPGFLQGAPVAATGTAPLTSMPSWPGQPFTCMTRTVNTDLQQNAAVQQQNSTTPQQTAAAQQENITTAPQHTTASHQENKTTAPETISSTETTTSPETISSSAVSSNQAVNSQASSGLSTSASGSQNVNPENITHTHTDSVSSVSNENSSQRDSNTRTVPRTESGGSNVRQRLVEPSRRVVTPGQVGQNAELPPERQSGRSVSLIIIVILGLAILALLLRRIYLSRYWRYLSF